MELRRHSSSVFIIKSQQLCSVPDGSGFAELLASDYRVYRMFHLEILFEGHSPINHNTLNFHRSVVHFFIFLFSFTHFLRREDFRQWNSFFGSHDAPPADGLIAT